MPTILMQIQSFLIVALMVWGITQHRQRLRHVRIMASAMIWDVILILQIELSRGAILKASQAPTNPLMLNIHVSIAVTTVLFYIAMVLTGRRLLRGETALYNRHRKLGYATFALRVLTFATSFLAVAPKDT
jgi:uncharacterized membrane protein YozB (DUF420 family)